MSTYMYRILECGQAALIPDISSQDTTNSLEVFPAPSGCGYKTVIVAAVVSGGHRHGVLMLDAPEANTLGAAHLEFTKTLASLLGIGLAPRCPR